MKKIAASLIVLAAVVCAWPGTSAAPADIDTLLRGAVEQKRVPLVVAMVADGRGVVYEHATGAGKDGIFAIASMTKPITSVAAMQLVEAGKLKLDAPASTYVPELKDVRVLDGGALRPPKTPITLRQLLSHTSGFSYEIFNKDIFGLVAKKEVASFMAGGDGFLKAPLVADPGTRWEYGISTDWVGRIVERVSGQTLDEYLRVKIFTPLGMSDTYFIVPAEKQPRVVPQFVRGPDGALTQQPPPPAPKVTFFSGGGGLFSTAPDYLRFVRALMAGGQLDKQRILSAESVGLMGRNQIGEMAIRPLPSLIPQFATNNAELPGALDKFGLGFALNSKPGGSPRGLNTMTWAGIFNTFFWIDRDKQVSAVFFTQMLPGLEPGVTKLVEEFDRAVYELKKTGSAPKPASR
jgi:CubicO group peptidase (beta-lactamase class C family)